MCENNYRNFFTSNSMICSLFLYPKLVWHHLWISATSNVTLVTLLHSNHLVLHLLCTTSSYRAMWWSKVMPAFPMMVLILVDHLRGTSKFQNLHGPAATRINETLHLYITNERFPQKHPMDCWDRNRPHGKGQMTQPTGKSKLSVFISIHQCQNLQ